YALSKLLSRLLPDAGLSVVAPESVSSLSKRLIESLPDFEVYDDFESADFLIMVDTCSFAQLGDLASKVQGSSAPLVVVDHHAPHPEVSARASLLIVDDSASSTAEIVYSIYCDLSMRLEEFSALALLVGMLYDSRRFINARSSTLRAAAHLIDAGADYSKALSVLHVPMDISERIARLKAAQRVKIYRVGDWVIATSHVGSFEASAARALIDLGADVAFVAGGDDSSLRISARARGNFYSETGIHLGKDLMEIIGKMIGGAGGGHATAAGANGVGNPEEALEICVKLLIEKLS
ncbi:MAG: DHH family phosphoesterase, partial [Candidatus Methanomethylicota archaeon]